MKYKIRIIIPSDRQHKLILGALLNRVATGFQFDCGTHFSIIKTDSIAWFATAVELLEAGYFTWEASSGC